MREKLKGSEKGLVSDVLGMIVFSRLIGGDLGETLFFWLKS